MSSTSIGLPFTPDVAIHYRCGDNTNSLYGFLAFRSFLSIIPKDNSSASKPRTIYILSEPSSRKTTANQVKACDAILTSLHKYLVMHFPASIIMLFRGIFIYYCTLEITFIWLFRAGFIR